MSFCKCLCSLVIDCVVGAQSDGSSYKSDSACGTLQPKDCNPNRYKMATTWMKGGIKDRDLKTL